MQHSNEPTNPETLSQLMDGEWYELNPSDCVADICADDAMRQKWTRYHLIRDAIKKEPTSPDLQLASRISAAIADEPSYSNITSFAPATTLREEPQYGDERPDDFKGQVTSEGTPSKGSPQTLSWWGVGLRGGALAASVSAVTVLGMTVWQSQQPDVGITPVASLSVGAAVDGRDVFSQQVPGAPLPEVELVANTGPYWMSSQIAERVSSEERLNMLLSQHIEHSPTAVREGLLPYSKLVGYYKQPGER